MVQEILQFNKPIKMVNSLLNTDPEKLSNLLSDPRGSHITDAFMLRFVFFVLLLKRGSSHKTIDFFQFLQNFLLNTEPEKLSNFLSDQISHITDAFMLRFVFFGLLKSGSKGQLISE